MKICRFRIHGDPLRRGRLGILQEKEHCVVDANTVWAVDYEREGRYNSFERACHRLPPSLHGLLTLRDNPLEDLEETLGLFLFLEKVGDIETKKGVKAVFPLEAVSLLNPLDKVNSLRDFYTHENHVAESFKKRGEAIPPVWYELPVYYKGATAGILGPGDQILWPSYTDKLDYELELAMVIGKEGKNIRSDKALEHAFGFTILNDTSARDIQKKEMAARLGPAKGKDFCSILGPVIATMDEFDFKEPDLMMEARVNGERWSQGRSSEAHYSWADMMAHLSRDEWVLPGDVLASGTVGTGCGLELDRWIRPGDQVELEIEKIGILANTVGRKEDGKF